MANKLSKSFHCSTEFTLAVLGGKWKTVILCYLTRRPCRYSELRRLMPMVSDKVLTERLRDLLSAGLISHRQGGGASPGTYSLAAKGRSLSKVLHQLYQWGHENAAKFHVKVGEPLEAFERGKPPRS
jgi:DNA-binding HxlR family transcriptional regulator